MKTLKLINLQVKCKTYFMWQVSKVKGKKVYFSKGSKHWAYRDIIVTS